MIINGKNYNLSDSDIREIGQNYLRNLFKEHLHCMDAYYCDQLNNEEVESARKQIEESESLTDDFLEGVMERFYSDDLLDVICEDTILEMGLDLDDEDEEEDGDDE